MDKHFLVQSNGYSYYFCGSDEGLQSGRGNAYEWEDVTCGKCLENRVLKLLNHGGWVLPKAHGPAPGKQTFDKLVRSGLVEKRYRLYGTQYRKISDGH